MIAILYIQDDTTYQDYVLMHYYCIIVLWLENWRLHDFFQFCGAWKRG